MTGPKGTDRPIKRISQFIQSFGVKTPEIGNGFYLTLAFMNSTFSDSEK